MKSNFLKILKNEVKRVDEAQISKRNEFIIDETLNATQVWSGGEKFDIFNSNDYLGLRINKKLILAEEKAARRYGVGPGAVRFISGSCKVYSELETKVADFHKKEAGMVFSSAFAANLGSIFSLIKGQSKDSLVKDRVLVVSDELNHRSIIDAIRLANLDRSHRAIFKHKDSNSLKEILEKNQDDFDRVLVITDGIFSMLGEVQNLASLKEMIDQYQNKYENGIFLVVDDAHGVGAFGKTGRGSEEFCHTQADILIGTFGKAFGCDGGYIVANQTIINYLRESAATYIYSNCMPPATAQSALESLKLVDSNEGKEMLTKLQENLSFFKEKMKETNFSLAVESNHPIQAILIGDPHETKKLVAFLRENKILATNINYPVVPKGKDEIRVQISAQHTRKQIEKFIECLKKA
jgi:glycine C-acetyltransferase